ncbi:hypothetical protein [Aeromonas phage 65.2]|uniref:Uncharacterized protein n=1 Tax=Aeromonas phage 65.2 TaxID=1932896 RepID=A0A219YCR6_9CAUD|nr:hypothetical protein [Aeromonas phage 65.2]
MGTFYIVGMVIFAIICILIHFQLQSIIAGRSVAKNQKTAGAVANRLKMIDEIKSQVGEGWKTYFNVVTFGVIGVLSLIWPVSVGIFIGIQLFNYFENTGK